MGSYKALLHELGRNELYHLETKSLLSKKNGKMDGLETEVKSLSALLAQLTSYEW